MVQFRICFQNKAAAFSASDIYWNFPKHPLPSCLDLDWGTITIFQTKIF
jgi:hypothetical protein